jgi:ADP-ribose pyrophosphatase YjhB (NUDIX family)
MMSHATEVSAGGVVLGPEGLLLVKVQNLEGRIHWTFPKGHLEPGETAEQAAVREVLEETGWRCRITGSLGTVQYQFRRTGTLVQKTVHWFRMAPEALEGHPDPDEILEARWARPEEARPILSYKSDLDIMTRLGF